MKKLKIYRIILSLAFFVMLTLLFVDVTGVAGAWSWTARLQFMPALLSFNAGLVLFWLVLSFLFGRVYCSSVCPLGTLQDVFGHLGRVFRKKGKVRYRYSPACNKLRYGILTLCAVAVVAGLSLIPALLDPYSAYGRMVTDLLQPAVETVWNECAGRSTVWMTTDIVLPGIAGTAVAAITLAVVGWLAWRNGRTFCNTVCPVGSLLSLCSRRAVWHMEIDTDKCVDCHRCEAVCKASCINLSEHAVDMSRCVLCFNCLAACHDGAITYTPYRRGAATPLMQRLGQRKISRTATPAIDAMSKSPEQQTVARRKFIALAGTVAAAGAVARAADGLQRATAVAAGSVAVTRRRAVMPPGASVSGRFHDLCTACQLCISRCPQHVLRASSGEYGVFHLLQPVMDYGQSYCRYCCNLCTTLCPTGALALLARDEKQKTPLGTAVCVAANCVTRRDDVPCGACARVCPTEAIDMVWDEGASQARPEVNANECIGCGRCEYVCPASPEKAIYVEGL